jgi:predicted dehydrogenase
MLKRYNLLTIKSNYNMMKRRKFISATAAAAGLTIIQRQILGGVGFTAPSDRLNLACIGTGTQGTRVMLQLLKLPEVQVVSVADPVLEDTRYQNWGEFELRNNIREAIEESGWDEGVKGCRAGREPARQIVDKWYSKQKSMTFKACTSYEDFRELLAKETGIDAVVIGTPDHQHAQVAQKAMEKGKHVFCQKPMTNAVYEARLLANTAKKTKLATQVATGNASAEDTDLLCEMIWSGAIGPVREVYNWSNRPVWQTGFTEIPSEEKIPKGFNWDLWLGRAEYRPFSYDYTHTVFRSWYDFGTGALGDMGCYSFAVIYRALKLGDVSTVEASGNTIVGVVNGNPQQLHYVSHPHAMNAHFTFPARAGMPPVDLFWIDGGMKPVRPSEFAEDGIDFTPDGLMFVGDYGRILCEFDGAEPKLIPGSKNKSYIKPPAVIERSKGHYADWIEACRGGKPARCNFESAAPITETLNLAIIAMRTGKKLTWDPVTFKTNNEEANKLIKPSYRPGWKI